MPYPMQRRREHNLKYQRNIHNYKLDYNKWEEV